MIYITGKNVNLLFGSCYFLNKLAPNILVLAILSERLKNCHGPLSFLLTGSFVTFQENEAILSDRRSRLEWA